MSTFLRTIEFLSLSLWLGSDVFLSFVVAPGVPPAASLTGRRESREHLAPRAARLRSELGSRFPLRDRQSNRNRSARRVPLWMLDRGANGRNAAIVPSVRRQ